MSVILEAIETLRERGSLEVIEGRIHYRGASGAEVQQAICVLRMSRDAAILALTADASRAVPPLERWPESLLDLARERAAQTGDPKAARREIWLSWCEWKAADLNRLFHEHGLTGKSGRITAETVRDGMQRASRRERRQ